MNDGKSANSNVNRNQQHKEHEKGWMKAISINVAKLDCENTQGNYHIIFSKILTY